MLDGVASPERLSGLLPIDGPDVLITSSADATAWAGACVLNVTALTPQDAMGLLCRYEPGLPMPEAERLAARLDHSPEALTHVGQRLSRKLSARQVLDMSHAELLELLRRGGICSPTERIRAAVEALAPEWRFAQDLLRALAMEAEARRLGVRARLTLADSYAVARILGIYDPAAALRKAEEAEHQQAKWLGERHRETLRTGSLIARLQLRCRLPDTAADQARSVWRAQCNVLGESDHETLETLHLLGEALEATGHSARAALTCYRDARKLRRIVLGEDHPATVESTNSYFRVKASLTPFAN